MTRRSARSTAAIAIATWCAAWAISSAALLRAEPTSYLFPLRVHASWRGVPTTEHEAWIHRQVSTANRLFAASRVQFAVQELVDLPASQVDAPTYPELLALAPTLDPAQIDVVLVRSLRALDDPREATTLIGICPDRSAGASWVAITIGEDDLVLAHELGHYFGLEHASSTQNVMYAHARPGPHWFDRSQVAHIVQQGDRFVRERRPGTIQLDLP